MPGEPALGDITVRSADEGFVISRVLSDRHHGQGWQFVATVKELAVAINLARTFAARHQSRAWWESADGYEPIV